MKKRLLIPLLACAAAAVLVVLMTYAPRATGLAVLGAGALGAVMLVRSMWLESRQLMDGEMRLNDICVHCGYDLRATSDRCPECGLRVE